MTREKSSQRFAVQTVVLKKTLHLYSFLYSTVCQLSVVSFCIQRSVSPIVSGQLPSTEEFFPYIIFYVSFTVKQAVL